MAALQEIHLSNSWLTIGTFDGVHQGHQEIIRNLTQGARAAGAPSVALTFHPHPSQVLRNLSGPLYLTTPEERTALLESMGVDVVVLHPFNREVANLTAYDFMSSLSYHLGFKQLWVGPDFALGHNRAGDIPMLREIGRELGYQVNVIQPFQVDGEVVSSRRVRAALASGDVSLVKILLGRPYQVSGKVVPGDGRGRLIGIPTANLETWSEKIIPKMGVYSCHAYIAGDRYNAVANIGVRPTFDNQSSQIHLEAHVLDYSGDLYDQVISLDFIARLRDEQRFPNVDALISQINRDIAQARLILE